MLVVCDSGSTKADWKFSKAGIVKHDITTRGFNPVFHDAETIGLCLSRAFSGEVYTGQVAQVFYYGAGCWNLELKQIVRTALSKIFGNATVVEVNHDILGAARATCGYTAGIACIIGTGSNACAYDGNKITDNLTHPGYLVGDEGSGSFLGKMLLRSYFYREMPSDLKTHFENFIPGGKAEILKRLYQEASPNVYLASFARFMSDYKKHIFIEKLVYQAFSEFVDRNIRKYAGHLQLPIHFVGSVAYHFSDILKVVLEERMLRPGMIIKKPIENLHAFHTDRTDRHTPAH